MKISKNHPNIIHYWGTSCPTETQVNIFTEFCPEGSLYLYIRTLKNALKNHGMDSDLPGLDNDPGAFLQSVMPLLRVQV